MVLISLNNICAFGHEECGSWVRFSTTAGNIQLPQNHSLNMNHTISRPMLTVAAGILALGITCSAARAQLTPSFTWSGNGNWSLDAVGSNNTPVGDVQANVPLGSTIVKAYLYSSIYNFNTANPSATTPNVTLDGTTYSGAAWTSLPP